MIGRRELLGIGVASTVLFYAVMGKGLHGACEGETEALSAQGMRTADS